MDKSEKDILEQQAKEMLIAGESFDTIMNSTGLRLKDVKRIQHDEVSSHF